MKWIVILLSFIVGSLAKIQYPPPQSYKPCSDECECFCLIDGQCIEEGYRECEECYCQDLCPRGNCCCRHPPEPCYCGYEYPCTCHSSPCWSLGLNHCQHWDYIEKCNRIEMFACCKESRLLVDDSADFRA
uniref:Uncharacterized protein n=1 Tax=Phragmatopoma lapidosa TaxID=341668 RepID=A0A0A0R3A1_9ANNE|nr:hypothetical protein [Phragmatopoma lapidosa]